ncbi:MAG TPA: hypothetical protein VKV96_02190 [Roseiarcus sp.]|nr:hypothetical protein [Roseiarcus sp.]
MRSVTAGLARQVLVAVAMSALLIAGLSVRPSGARVPVGAAAEKPIATRAIVTAEAPPAAPAKRAAVKLAAAAKPAARLRLVAPTPRPRPTDPAAKVIAAAYVPPAPEPSAPSLKKRLFAPIGFVRDNVARLISWL